jgi:hypothetical protein
MSANSEPVFTMSCPACRKKLRLAAKALGKKAKCPACQTVIQIPATAPGSAVAPAVAPPAAPAVAKAVVPRATAPASPVFEPTTWSDSELFDVAPSRAATPAETTFPDLGAGSPAKIKYPKPAQRGSFRAEKKGIDNGVLGGLGMIAGAVIWFVVGWACGYIFFYPPILLLIGVFAVVKGLMTGNITGRKRRR